MLIGSRSCGFFNVLEGNVTTAAIYDTIEMAKLHEKQSGSLACLFEHYINSNIPLALQLPERGATQSLVDFIIAYIEHVPSLLDATRQITREAKVEAYAEPFLQLAEDFFLKPPEIVAEHVGLEELMDEAYLAHRLMEEVNDRFMIRATIPLVPVDMTTANLLVHSLIGEPFANELDEAVFYAVERAMVKEYVYDSDEFKAYIAQHRSKYANPASKQWPCLLEELSINLQFSCH